MWDTMEILYYEALEEANEQGLSGRRRSIEIARADLKSILRNVQNAKPRPDEKWILAGPMPAWEFQEIIRTAQTIEKYHGRRTMHPEDLQQ